MVLSYFECLFSIIFEGLGLFRCLKGDCDQARLYLEKTVERLYPDRARFKTPGSEVNAADRLACAKVPNFFLLTALE